MFVFLGDCKRFDLDLGAEGSKPSSSEPHVDDLRTWPQTRLCILHVVGHSSNEDTCSQYGGIPWLRLQALHSIFVKDFGHPTHLW